MMTSPVGLNRATGRFETIEAVGAGGPGMQRGARTALTSSTTITLATDTNLVPPTGWVLAGIEVIAIGAGGAGSSLFNVTGGAGGQREHRFVWAEELGPTVVVTVGAGATDTKGGTSSFGDFVVAVGGAKSSGTATQNRLITRRDYEAMVNGASSGPSLTSIEGSGSSSKGFNAPLGIAGGGGGGSQGSDTTNVGGAAYPHPNAFSANYVAAATAGASGYALQGAGNPVTTAGATGHTGIGDGAGGGGNSGFYNSAFADFTSNGGIGGFPGGGGGSGGAAARGGHGVVIYYPWFRKAT